MTEYLSKEEIRQWRSSLEKITLEEFATRLGKSIKEEKETRDIVDIILEKTPVLVNETYRMKTEKINTIAEKAFKKETELHITEYEPKKVQITKKEMAKKAVKSVKSGEIKEKVKTKKQIKVVEKPVLLFKKPLTDREQVVFDYFVSHKNSIVYAKDLATLLELPRDYVYKYIRNLRKKIIAETLENSDNGGYILKA